MATNIGVVKVLTFEGAHGPRISNLALSIISALLLVLSFPGFEYSLLAWVALAPLILAVVRERRWWRAFLLGEAAGSIFFYGTCWWITHSMIEFGGVHPVIAYTVIVIPTLLLGLFPALFALLLSRIVLRAGPAAMLLAPFLWTGTEFLRLKVTGMPWNSLGYSQAFAPALIQTASIGGVYFVSFLLALMATLLALMAVADRQRIVFLSGVLILFVLALNHVYGRSALNSVPARRTLKLIAIQPDFPMPMDPDAVSEDAALARLSGQTATALQRVRLGSQGSRSEPVVVVWPESPLNFDWYGSDATRSSVSSALSAAPAYLLLNAVVQSVNGQSYNSVLGIGPGSEVIGRYDKLRLLPFGEYVPMRRWIPFIGRIRAIAGDFTPGERVKLIPLGNNKIAPSICFEAAFPALGREGTRSGADLFVNVTNDGWFGTTPEARQHLAHAVFRTVENHLAMARVANSGFTTLIDPNGRILDSTELFRSDVRVWDAPVAAVTQTTFYTRHGDWAAWLCLIATILAAAFAIADGYWQKRRPVIEFDDE